MFLRQLTRRFLTTGRPLMQEEGATATATKWPNKKRKLTAWEIHNHGEDIAPEKIMSKAHYFWSLMAVTVAGYGFEQYIMYSAKFRVRHKKSVTEI